MTAEQSFVSLTAVVRLARPFNLGIAVLTVFLGAHIALEGDWNSDVALIVGYHALSVLLFMAAGNTINDANDAQIDRIAHPMRPIPSGEITAESAIRVALAEMFIASVIAVMNPTTLVIFIPALLLMITYELGPMTKSKGLIGNIAISLMVAAVILYGAAAVDASIGMLVIFAASAAFFVNLARELVKDCEDINADSGRKTLPMSFGLMNTRLLAYGMCMIGMVLAALPFYVGVMPTARLFFMSPAILVLIMLNIPLFKGEDRVAQQRMRVAMLLALLGFTLSVSI